MELPDSALYTSWTNEFDGAKPEAYPFGTDFGNGEADRRVFQIDSDFERYSENKRAALRERRGKYVRVFRLERAVERAAIELVIDRLVAEYPERFSSGWEGESRTLSEEDKTWVLPAYGRGTTSPALDLLARLVPEDLVVVSWAEGRNWVSYAHVCSPHRVGAEEWVGRPFFGPEIEEAGKLGTSPTVRFAWSIESDDRLNRHPDPPAGFDPAEWAGRDIVDGRFVIRTERRIIWGMPADNAAFVTIRVGHVPDTAILADPNLRATLHAALLAKPLGAEWTARLRLD